MSKDKDNINPGYNSENQEVDSLNTKKLLKNNDNINYNLNINKKNIEKSIGKNKYFFSRFISVGTIPYVIYLILFSLSCLMISNIYLYYRYIDVHPYFNHEKLVHNKDINVRLLSHDDRLIKEFPYLLSRKVDLTKVPKSLYEPFVFLSDPNFFKRNGINFIDFSLIFNADYHPQSLTFKLSKILFKNAKPSYFEGLRLFLLGQIIHFLYDRTEILSWYLQHIHFQYFIHGIEKASWYYFSRDFSHLTLKEACFLALLSLSDEHGDKMLSDDYQGDEKVNELIEKLSKNGFLDQYDFEELNKLKSNIVQLNHLNFLENSDFDLFSLSLLHRLSLKISMPYDHVNVKTTIDLDIKHFLDRYLIEEIEKLKDLNVSAGGMVVMDKFGHVLAFSSVNQRSKDIISFNPIFLSGRPTASLFSFYSYVLAFVNGASSTQWVDILNINNDKIMRFYNEPQDPSVMILKQAFLNQVKFFPKKVLEVFGQDHFKHVMRQLGIKSSLSDVRRIIDGLDPITLLELTHSLSMVINGGFSTDIHFFREIDHQSGEVLYREDHGAVKSVLSYESLLNISDLLVSNVYFGPARNGFFQHPIGALTSTTPYHQDAWYVGFSSEYIVGVWLGNEDGSSMVRVTGQNHAANLWRKFMEQLHLSRPISAIDNAIRYNRKNLSKHYDINLF